jgi:IPT/TIG domain
MKSSALERKSLVCLVTLLAASIPMIFTACAGGLITPANGSQQSSTVKINSVAPDSGPRTGGTAVLINGTNLAPVAQNTPPSVSFGGVAASQITIVSPLQVEVVIPAHVTGTVSVQVTTADGESTTLAGGFTYTSGSAMISGVSPNSGPTAGGTAVTVNGSNFSSGATVSFGGTAAPGVSFVSSTQLKATTPAHAAGAVSVQVTNPDGTSATLANAFTYGSTTLSVNSVSPISGPAEGGTSVTISGSNFQSGMSVSFGGFATSSITVSNSTTIKAITPTHSSGSVTVTVTNPAGQSATLSSGFTFHSVDLVWSAPASTPVPITGYNVYRAMSSGGPFGRLNGSTPISNTSYSDGTVQGATTYYYEVKSVDSNGTESAPEGPAQATTSP